MKHKFLNYDPQIDSSVFIAQGANIIGNVIIGANSNIWFNCTIRGDVESITIGENTNIQDGTIIHVSRNNGPTKIGDGVTIGHNAIIHACTLEDYSFIGMGSIILDGATVEKEAMVAAGAVVSPGKIVKSRELWAGVPAKKMRDLSDAEIENIYESYKHYVRLAGKYKE